MKNTLSLKTSPMRFLFHLLILFILSTWGYSQSTTCETAFPKINSVHCSYSLHELQVGDDQFWTKFTPVVSEKYELKLDSIRDQATISSVVLYTGNCNQLVQLGTYSVGTLPSLLETSMTLNQGQDYYFKINFAPTTDIRFISFCITPKSIGTYWTNYFSNQNGQYLNCQTKLPIDNTLAPHGNQNCNEITLCVNETLNLQLDEPVTDEQIPSNIIGAHHFQFVQQNGASVATTSNGTLSTLSFSQTGIVKFLLIPIQFMNQSTSPMTILPYIMNADQAAFTFTINVVDTYANATWNSSNILCSGQTSFLVPQPGTTITQVKINNVTQNQLIQNNQVVINGSNYPVGTHTVTYTLNGACGPKTFTTTFQVINGNNVIASSDNCGNATWNVSLCSPGQNIDLVVFNANGPIITTSMTSVLGNNVMTGTLTGPGPYFWEVTIGTQILGNGTVPNIVPQNLPISGNSVVCELFTGLSIPSSPFLSNIVWTVSPNANFDGQGTTNINPIGSWNQNNTYIITVTAQDANGCKYAGTKTIGSCCVKKWFSAEAFEQDYLTQWNSFNNGFSSNTYLPANMNKGPNEVSINIVPPPPSYLFATNTAHSTTTTITQLKALLGVAPTANIANITNKWIFINNDLIVDQNVSIINCPFIRIAPGKKIIVSAGRTLTINNSTLAAKCDQMWQGIVLSTATSKIVTTNNTNILEAVIGVESIAGAVFQLDQTRFIDNAKGVVVRAVAGTHAGYVRNCYFGDITTRNLLAPYQTKTRPEIGIEVIGTTITIGNPNNNATNRGGNVFHRQEIGIKGDQANLTVYGNTFYQIAQNPGGATTGNSDHRGIHAMGPSTLINRNNLILGSLDSKLNSNNFVQCANSVHLERNMNAQIHSNVFKDLTYSGVWLDFNTKCDVIIRSNYFSSRNSNAYGVRIFQYSRGPVQIEHNQVNQVNFYPNPFNTSDFFAVGSGYVPHLAAGIMVSNTGTTTIPTIPNVNILQNKIRQCVYGVYILSENKPNIEANTIDFDFTDAQILANTSYDYSGILLGGTSNAIVKYNQITNLRPFLHNSSPLFENDLAGIRLENAFKSTVLKNTMTRMPAGLYARYQNGQSAIDCNTFVDNRYGFKFLDTELGNQGYPPNVNPTYPNGYAPDNTWTEINNVVTFRSDGSRYQPSVNNVMKYYWYGFITNSSKPTNFLDFPNYYDNIQLFNYNGNRPESGCAVDTRVLTIEEKDFFREEAYGKFIENDSLSAEEKAYAEREVYRKMKEDEAYLNLGTANDQKYTDFIADYENTDGALSVKVQEYIEKGMRDSATYFNNQISLADEYRKNNKLVQGWYLEAWNNSDSIFAPTEEIRLNLVDMACRDPWEAGDAVYQARAIMGWLKPCDPDNNFGFKSGEANELISHSETPISVHPNPSQDAFVVDFPYTEKIEFILSDINGKLVQKLEAHETDSLRFEHNLKPGIYLLQIILENQQIYTQKIRVE